jgi:uncharacterized protein YjbI with pentapeptide repeats
MRTVVAAAILTIILAAPAWACSCGGPKTDLEAIRGPSIIFRGTAVAEENVQPAQRNDCRGGIGPECAATPTIRFKVQTLYKGPAGRDEVLHVMASRQDGVNCGVSFRLGSEELVAAYGDSQSGYRTSMCAMPWPKFEQAFAAYRSSTEDLRRQLSASPKDTAVQRRLAEHYVLHADWENTRDLLRAATAPDLLTLLGQAELGLSHGEAALAAFDRALAVAPDLPAARKGRTAALLSLGRTNGFGPGTDFSGTEARKLRLAGLDLSGSSLAASDFSETVAEGAKLDGANFRRSRFYDLRAAKASLRDADFRHAQMSYLDLSQADLRGATFKWARLGHVLFRGADLTRVDFTAAEVEDADFSGATLTGATLVGVQLSGCRLSGADLSGQSLAGASLSGNDLSGAKLVGADLRGADLSTRYRATRLHGADLTDARLDGVGLSGTQYDCHTRWPAGFDPAAKGALYDAAACPGQPRPAPTGLINRHAGPGHGKGRTGSDTLDVMDADLAGVDLSHTDLRRVQFKGGSLAGASLAGAWLEGSSFTDVDLSGADFTGVDLRKVKLSRGAAKATHLVLRNTVLDAQVIDGLGIDLASADLTGAAIDIDPEGWRLPFNPLERGAFFLKVARAVPRFGLPDLRGANLTGRTLIQADFTGVDLSGADLRGVRLEQTILTGAILSGARFDGAVLGSSTKWPAGFNPAAAHLVYSQGHYSCRSTQRGGAPELPRSTTPIDFSDAVLDGVNWTGVWLERGTLTRTSLKHARLECVNLSHADLRSAILDRVSLNDSTLDNADLTGALLRRSDLRRASLRGANLTGADLTGAWYNDDTVWPDGFDPVGRGAVRQ